MTSFLIPIAGDTIVLEKNWSFSLHPVPTNMQLGELLHAGFKSSFSSVRIAGTASTEVMLPKGTVLIVDRVTVTKTLKSVSVFDSYNAVTFRIASHPTLPNVNQHGNPLRFMVNPEDANAASFSRAMSPTLKSLSKTAICELFNAEVVNHAYPASFSKKRDRAAWFDNAFIKQLNVFERKHNEKLCVNAKKKFDEDLEEHRAWCKAELEKGNIVVPEKYRDEVLSLDDLERLLPKHKGITLRFDEKATWVPWQRYVPLHVVNPTIDTYVETRLSGGSVIREFADEKVFFHKTHQQDMLTISFTSDPTDTVIVKATAHYTTRKNSK